MEVADEDLLPRMSMLLSPSCSMNSNPSPAPVSLVKCFLRRLQRALKFKLKN